MKFVISESDYSEELPEIYRKNLILESVLVIEEDINGKPIYLNKYVLEVNTLEELMDWVDYTKHAAIITPRKNEKFLNELEIYNNYRE